MKRASLLVLLIAFACALPALAAGPANAVPAVQAPAVAVPGTQASASPAPALATPDATTLTQNGLPQAPVVEATTCTVSVLCPNGTRFTCSGTVCIREPRCFIYCDTTGSMKCAPAYCP